MTIIVQGATGAQGAPVLAALTAGGHAAVGAVRDPSRLPDGVEGRAVDLFSVDSLTEAYAGADGVFVHLPLGSPDEQMTVARNVSEAVRSAAPGRVVLSTSGYPVIAGDETSPISVLAAALLESSVRSVVLEPRLFLENLLLPPVADGAREGTLRYPLPVVYATSWASHLDVADAAARLFERPDLEGTVHVGALPGLLGADLARGFQDHLGRPVVYEAIDPDAFGSMITPLFGPEASGPVVASYHARQDQPGDVIPEATSAQELLDLRPRSVAAWLAELGV